MPKGVPLTEEEQVRRRREIIDCAVPLFFNKGYTETSMREIAESAGTGKSTLYDYFKTKDDILVAYFEEELQAITQQAEAVSKTGGSAVEKLRQIMQAHLQYLLQNKKFYLKMTVEAQRLSLHGQQRIQESRHAYQDLLCRLIEAGIAEGSFRPVDPLLAMRIILSTMNPIVFTTRPTGSPQEMLTSALDILLNGLRA